MTDYLLEFRANLARAFGHISTYVVLVVTGTWSYWLQMGPAEQAAILAAFPELRVAAPIASYVMFLVAKGLPQKP